MTPVIEQKEKSPSDRFMEACAKAFKDLFGNGIQLSQRQQELSRNYFLQADISIKQAEQARLAKAPDKRDALEVSWKNIDYLEVARQVVRYSAIGLDPLEPNQINLIPYKDNKANNYKMQFTQGYRGYELKAKKYGYEVPDAVQIDLVFENDTFELLKRDKDTREENIVFKVNDPFHRGNLKGGFFRMIFSKEPEKNYVVVLSKAEIDKRKPKYASAEFWGGKKTEWVKGEGGRNERKEVETEGWYNEMAWKTIAISAYKSITIDSAKIDDNLRVAFEAELKDEQIPPVVDIVDTVHEEIKTNANQEAIGFTEPEVIETKIETKEEVAVKAQAEARATRKPVQQEAPKEEANGTQNELRF